MHEKIRQDPWVNLKLDYTAAVANWFLDTGDTYVLRGDFEKGLRCNYMAARVLCRQNRDLSCSRIEANLQLFARILPERKRPQIVTPVSTERKEMWLHVLNEALPYGGHTAMATRWIKNDRRRAHSVALFSQKLPIPCELLQAVSESGGDVYCSNPNESFLGRADWLRKLAYELANYVVLHIDVDDVIAGVAFGCDGGPPVLVVNHAAHLYWTGASIADLVLNSRGSELEEYWTEIYRGVPRYATIPIPLMEPTDQDSERPADSEKDQAKESIGIPKDSVLILTVGDSYKYTPIDRLDFIKVCEDILREVPEAYIAAVGPEEDSYWRMARDRLGSRLRAFGRQPRSRIPVFHQAADLYIEGFPFGSTTALLEAGLRKIPVVLAPAQCPPPYGSDGVALDEALERPSTVEEYKTRVMLLSRSPADREYWGNRICEAITKHHTGSGWRNYVENAISKLPEKHSICPATTPVRTPESVHEHWARFQRKVGPLMFGLYSETMLESFVTDGFSMGLRPRLTKAMLRACKEARLIRIHRSIPLPLLVFLLNFLLPLLPIVWADRIFLKIANRCRPGCRTMRFILSRWPAALW